MALKSMGGLKALGPEDFQAMFYQRAWNLVENDVNAKVLKILKGEGMKKELAEALLVLIPKNKKPSNIKQFRPISLCNVIF